jgi:hypothetical protein
VKLAIARCDPHNNGVVATLVRAYYKAGNKALAIKKFCSPAGLFYFQERAGFTRLSACE